MNEHMGFGEGIFNFNKNPDQNQDVRYLPRWKVKNRVKYTVDNGLVIDECETHDLSCSGARLKVSKIIIPGQTVKMKIYLDQEESVEVAGHVMWNRITENGRFIGVHFETTPLEIQQTILNHAFEINPDELVKHWFSDWQEKKLNQTD